MATVTTASAQQLDTLCINTIRTLSMDAVSAGELWTSGHAMGMAPVAYELWQSFCVRPGRCRLAESRPVCAVDWARFDAALLYASFDGREAAGLEQPPYRQAGCTARRHQAFSPVGEQVSGPSGVPLDFWRGNDHRARSDKVWRTA